MGDNVIFESGIARIGPEDVRRLSKHRLRAGDILFSRRGDVGRRAIVRPEHEGWLCGTGCLAVKFGKRQAHVNPEFVALAVGTAAAQDWILDNAVGGTMLNLNTSILSALPISLPSKQEQDWVVNALSSNSAQVGVLERLLSKQRDLKQGVMQQLLTGETRLPSSTGAWTPLRVAAVSHLKARIGWQGLTTQEYRSTGEFRLVGGTDFRGGRVDWAKTPFVDRWRFDQDANIQLRAGDVLITKDGTIGKVAFVDSLPGPATLNSGVFVVRPKRDAYVSEFLYWVLRSRIFEEFVAGLSAGSTINHLYQRDLVKLEIQVPPTLREQRAIARVVSDIDDEVITVARQLESAQSIRTGMMQQLLTGRTRPPVGGLL